MMLGLLLGHTDRGLEKGKNKFLPEFFLGNRVGEC
jgi:hypothetical protein